MLCTYLHVFYNFGFEDFIRFSPFFFTDDNIKYAIVTDNINIIKRDRTADAIICKKLVMNKARSRLSWSCLFGLGLVPAQMFLVFVLVLFSFSLNYFSNHCKQIINKFNFFNF